MRKIIIAPGYGGGWSTWFDGPPKFACEYQPIIAALENGEVLTKKHPAVLQFMEDASKYSRYVDVDKFTLRQLEVVEVSVPYKVTEFDGYERVVFNDDSEWIF